MQYFRCIPITHILWCSSCIFCTLFLHAQGHLLANTAFAIALPAVKASYHNCFQEFIALPDYSCSTCVFHAKNLSQREVFGFAKTKSDVFKNKNGEKKTHSTLNIKALATATSEKGSTGRQKRNQEATDKQNRESKYCKLLYCIHNANSSQRNYLKTGLKISLGLILQFIFINQSA